ncbi:MAG: hypothetical protein LBV17_01250 [Treponema sp.]|jgi:hypothetical protein|nr:hypothetical protein [Treponema sp.]
MLEAGAFQQVVDDYISGKKSKDQSLQLLEYRYKSASINIRQHFGEDRIGASYCCYVPCDFDEWIKICDDAERNRPLSERLRSSGKIQTAINKYQAKCKKNDLESGDCIVEVNQEVHEIQNLCRQNRELTNWYEECKAKIEALSDILIKKKKNTSREIIHILLYHIPPKVKKHEPKLIKKINKIIPAEYWILTSVEDVKFFLEGKQKSGEIEIDDIPGFMKTYLKGKKGGDISASFRVEKHKNRKKT